MFFFKGYDFPIATSMFAYWKVDTTQTSMCTAAHSGPLHRPCAGTAKAFATATGTVSINGDISQASGKRLDGSDGSGFHRIWTHPNHPQTVSSNTWLTGNSPWFLRRV